MFPNPLTKNARNRTLLIIALASVVISACSFVRIQNTSDAHIQVLVKVPDHNQGYSRAIGPGDIVDVFSGHGGRYSVTLLPSEAYLELLNSAQQEISNRLFSERATLTGNDVGNLVARLQDIQRDLNRLALPAPSCSGSLPDFETSVVVVVWDTAADQWGLSCS